MVITHAAGDRYYGKRATVVCIDRLASLRGCSDPFLLPTVITSSALLQEIVQRRIKVCSVSSTPPSYYHNQMHCRSCLLPMLNNKEQVFRDYEDWNPGVHYGFLDRRGARRPICLVAGSPGTGETVMIDALPTISLVVSFSLILSVYASRDVLQALRISGSERLL